MTCMLLQLPGSLGGIAASRSGTHGPARIDLDFAKLEQHPLMRASNGSQQIAGAQ